MAEITTTEPEISDFASIINQTNELNNSGGHSFIDGDTVRNSEGQLIRIEGLEAAEVSHINEHGITPGTAGGLQAATSIQNLANKFGYTNVEYLTNPDGSVKMDATGSRIMGRLKDKRGRDLTEMATRYGVNQVGLFSTEDEISSSMGCS